MILDKLQLTSLVIYACCLLWIIFGSRPNWDNNEWVILFMRTLKMVAIITLILTTLIRIWI